MGDETAAHPGWCANNEGACDPHLSRPVDIPATAGRHRVDDTGASFPRVEAAAARTDTGGPAVHLAVFDPTGRDGPRWAAAVLTVAEFRALLEHGARLLALAERDDDPSGTGRAT